MATVRIYLDTRRIKRNGGYPIKIVVNHIRDIMISTGHSALKSQWVKDELTKAVPNYRAKNANIAALRLKIERILLDLERDGKLHKLSDKQLKEIITSAGEDRPKSSFMNTFRRFAESREAESTKRLYLHTLEKVTLFDERVAFENVNLNWLNNFDAFLSKGGESTNTRAIHLRNIRAVFNHAIDYDNYSNKWIFISNMFLSFGLNNNANIVNIFTENKIIMEKVINRLIKFQESVKNEYGGRNKFETMIGVSEGYLTKILKSNKGSIGSDIVESILDKFPYLNINWLFTGEGDMLKQDAKTLTLYDVDAAAGYESFDVMISKEKVVGEFVVPTFASADWMIHVRGSSMYPKYSSGDIIACKVIKESRFIQWNKIYVIATREQGLLVKRIMPSEKEDCIKAVSDNEKYPPFDIPKDEIFGFALVLGAIKLE